jgi:hypothetical protein
MHLVEELLFCVQDVMNGDFAIYTVFALLALVYIYGLKPWAEQRSKLVRTVHERCIVSIWSLAHVLFYFLIARKAPQAAKLAFYLGILWEIFEILFTPSGDPLDILWNWLGLRLGARDPLAAPGFW